MTQKQPKLVMVKPWWTQLYLYGCVIFAGMFGQMLDVEKIVCRVLRHTKWKVEL